MRPSEVFFRQIVPGKPPWPGLSGPLPGLFHPQRHFRNTYKSKKEVNRVMVNTCTEVVRALVHIWTSTVWVNNNLNTRIFKYVQVINGFFARKIAAPPIIYLKSLY